MSDEHKQYASTSAATLEAHILSVHSAKSEAEWWAQREIERLRAENEKLRAALKPFADLQPEDFDYDGNGEVIINCDDLRVARAAMGETGND